MKCSTSLTVICIAILLPATLLCQEDDPYLWLEDIQGQKALAWVGAQNDRTVDAITGNPAFDGMKERILSILNSKDRIPSPSIRGEYIYNFWKDAVHARGILRRVPIEGYFTDDPDWETVLDIDALSAAEGVNWSFGGAQYLYPDYDRCMIRLSRGGSDAVEMREFDLTTGTFVQGGFFLPTAKAFAGWIDENTLLVSTDFGEGSTTQSGYPRIVKRWKRGTSLEEAETLFEGEESDVAVVGFVVEAPERQYLVVYRSITTFTSHAHVLEDGAFVKLDIPEDAQFGGFFKGNLLVFPRSDWDIGGHSYPAGAMLAINYDAFLEGDRAFEVLFTPEERTSLDTFGATRDAMLVSVLNNVRSELYRWSFEDGAWSVSRIDLPENGSISVGSADEFSDRFFFYYEDFLEPRTMYYASGEKPDIRVARSLPHYFDAENLEVHQYEARSADGEQIPYFVVARNDVPLDGSSPTLLYAYGGFEVAMRPRYSATVGAAWLEHGGVYVMANIRGGGEFGPKWHQAARREKRQTAFNDFYAVSEDLIRRKITSPAHLGIMGGSNGGLLVGVALTQHPELYRAVVCSNPLLDMKRYHTLLAGASWMDEYGDPGNPDDWKFISRYSPYHNLSVAAHYPAVLFTTTTHDDRVHPGHARKMAAKMTELGHDILYFENTEGGHGSGVTNEQRAYMTSIEFAFLLNTLK